MVRLVGLVQLFLLLEDLYLRSLTEKALGLWEMLEINLLKVSK